MGVLKTIGVALTAKTGNFFKIMNRAARAVNSFVKNAIWNSLRTGGYMAMAAGAGLAYMVKQQFAAIDANGKLANSLGISTESLGGLQYAADLANVSNETLSTALSKTAMMAGKVESGDKAATKAFNDLGISAAQIAGKNPADIFLMVSDSISKMSNPTERAAAASELFGRSWQSLMPLLQEGSAGIATAGAEAEKMGLAVSGIDTAKVEMANDALTRLWSVVKGLANQIAVALSPYIQAAADDLFEMGTKGEGMGQRVTNAMKWIKRAIGWVGDQLNLLKVPWYALKSVAEFAIGGILLGIGWIDTQLKKIPPVLDMAGAGYKGMAAIAVKYLGEIMSSLGDLISQFDGFFYGLEQAANALGMNLDISKFFKDTGDSMQTYSAEWAGQAVAAAEDAQKRLDAIGKSETSVWGDAMIDKAWEDAQKSQDALDAWANRSASESIDKWFQAAEVNAQKAAERAANVDKAGATVPEVPAAAAMQEKER
jgi:uncharacterized protein YjeT (DUF2065 family)